MTDRKDDEFGRKVMGALVVALILQGLGGLYYAGVLVNKIETNAGDIMDMKKSIEQLRKVNNRLIRIEVLMETVVVGNNKISDSQAVFSSEQQRHIPLINEAVRHIRDARLHK